MQAESSAQTPNLRKALLAGILANLGVAVVKFVAFSFTHSTAMLAESVHSVADSSNQLLLFVGLKRAAKPADELHPFGYSVERYFWGFVVAVNIFVLGAVVAIYEGTQKILHPHAIQNVMWNYAALGLAAIFEAAALRVAWKEFRHWRAENTGSLWQQLRRAKDLTLPTVLFEDSAALLGLLIAAIGIALAHTTGMHWFDGLASVLIGLILLVVAWFLAVESHSLLLGESATKHDRKTLRTLVESDPAVVRLLRLDTLQRGPDNILVALEIDFLDELDTGAIETAVGRIEDAIQAQIPAAKNVYVEASSFRTPSMR